MKILKYLAFLILLLVFGAVVYIATLDGKFDISKNKIIEAPVELIYSKVDDYRNWPEWGPWFNMDPKLRIQFGDTTTGIGASYAWTSLLSQIGNGSIQTIDAIPNKEIIQKITFNTPMSESNSSFYWLFDATEDPSRIKLTWGMRGAYTFMEKVRMIFNKDSSDGFLDEMILSGLDNIQALVIEEMETFSISVNGIVEFEGGYFLYTSSEVKQEELASTMGDNFGQIMTLIETAKLEVNGMPFTIYNRVDSISGLVNFSSAIPIQAHFVTAHDSEIQCSLLEPTMVLKTTLLGKYNNLPAAYEKAFKYLAEHNIQIDPAKKMFEIYQNDPGEVQNPAEWVTEIYIPIILPLTPEF